QVSVDPEVVGQPEAFHLAGKRPWCVIPVLEQEHVAAALHDLTARTCRDLLGRHGGAHPQFDDGTAVTNGARRRTVVLPGVIWCRLMPSGPGQRPPSCYL